MFRCVPRSTLFPYTTLFRSTGRVLRLVGTYGELTRGRAGALVGSHGRLEIAVNAGSAAVALGAGRGTAVVVSRTSTRSEEHTSELQSLRHLVCRLLLEKKKT